MSDTAKEQLRQYILLAVVTFLAGGGGASVMGRPDPFTGGNARELEDRMNKRVDALERRFEEHQRRGEESMSEVLQELAGIRQQLIYLNSGYNPARVSVEP